MSALRKIYHYGDIRHYELSGGFANKPDPLGTITNGYIYRNFGEFTSWHPDSTEQFYNGNYKAEIVGEIDLDGSIYRSSGWSHAVNYKREEKIAVVGADGFIYEGGRSLDGKNISFLDRKGRNVKDYSNLLRYICEKFSLI